MYTGMTFGMSSGGVGEYLRQKSTNESISLAKIIEHAAKQGLVDSVAASIGGIQGDPGFRSRAGNYFRRVGDNVKTGTNAFRNQAVSLADSLSNGGRLIPAYAGVPAGFAESVRLFESSPASSWFRQAGDKTPTRPTVLQMHGGEHHGGGDFGHNGDGHGYGYGYGHDYGGHSYDTVGDNVHSGTQDFAMASTQGGAPRRSGANLENVVGGKRADATAGGDAPAKQKLADLPTLPDLVPVVTELNRLSNILCDRSQEHAPFADVVNFLRTHPMKGQADFIAAANDLATVKDHSVVKRAVQLGLARSDGMIWNVYNGPTGQRTTDQLWFELQTINLPLLGSDNSQTAAAHQAAVGAALDLYPELRPACEQYAKNSDDPQVVARLDKLLGSTYSEKLGERLEKAKQAELNAQKTEANRKQLPDGATKLGQFEAMDEGARHNYLAERLKQATPANAVTLTVEPDGTKITANNNPADDGTYKSIVERDGEFRRCEFKNGDAITHYADGRWETVLADGSGFKIDPQVATDVVAPAGGTTSAPGGDSGAKPADATSAGLEIPPIPLVVLLSELAKGLSTGTPDQRAEVAGKIAERTDMLSAEDFQSWMKAANSVEILARGLESHHSERVLETVNAIAGDVSRGRGSAEVQLRWREAAEKMLAEKKELTLETIKVLGDHISELSDQSFLNWKDAAGNKLADGWILTEPAIEALPVDIQKGLLSDVVSEAQKRMDDCSSWRAPAC